MGSLFDGIVTNAEKLGALSVASVWAFFTIILIGYIAYDMKAKKEAAGKAYDARLEDAKSDIMVANALNRMVDEIKEFRRAFKCIGGKE